MFPRILGLVLTLFITAPRFGFSQETRDGNFDRTGRNIQGDTLENEQPEQDRRRRRATPSGLYSDPASFFRVHGYATLRYGFVQDQLGTTVERAAQILVSQPSPRSGENEGGFRSDAAVFIGAEPFEGLSSTVELHFVGNGLDPVLTEAKLTYDFLPAAPERAVSARLHAGRYWWPFGIHDREWFSAVNRFPLISPVAGEVVPAHYNEVGLMLEGEALLSSTFGLNLALSIGNGVPGFTVRDAVRLTGFDFDGELAASGRIAAYVNSDDLLLEIGLSGAAGSLRNGTTPTPLETLQAGVLDPSFQYSPQQIAQLRGLQPVNEIPASFRAAGVDLTLRSGGFIIDGYVYISEESLDRVELLASGLPDSLPRQGFNVEVGYEFKTGWNFLKKIAFFGRASIAWEEELVRCFNNGRICQGLSGEAVQSEELRWGQFGGVAILHLTSTFLMRAAYLTQSEREVDLDNDVFSLSLTANF